MSRFLLRYRCHSNEWPSLSREPNQPMDKSCLFFQRETLLKATVFVAFRIAVHFVLKATVMLSSYQNTITIEPRKSGDETTVIVQCFENSLIARSRIF